MPGNVGIPIAHIVYGENQGKEVKIAEGDKRKIYC